MTTVQAAVVLEEDSCKGQCDNKLISYSVDKNNVWRQAE